MFKQTNEPDTKLCETVSSKFKLYYDKSQEAGSSSFRGPGSHLVHDPDSFPSETAGGLPVHWEAGGARSPEWLGRRAGVVYGF